MKADAHTDFPAEIPVPLQPENILRTQHTGFVGGESEQPDILLQGNSVACVLNFCLHC